MIYGTVLVKVPWCPAPAVPHLPHHVTYLYEGPLEGDDKGCLPFLPPLPTGW